MPIRSASTGSNNFWSGISTFSSLKSVSSIYPVHQKQPEKIAMVQSSKNHECWYSPKCLFQACWHSAGSCSRWYGRKPQLSGNKCLQDKSSLSFLFRFWTARGEAVTWNRAGVLHRGNSGGFGTQINWKALVPCALPCFVMPKVT